MDPEDLKCPVCHNKYDTDEVIPRIIPVCGHSVCTPCLIDAIHELEGDKYVCPVDGEEFELPEKHISSFPNNFTLINYLEREEEEADEESQKDEPTESEASEPSDQNISEASNQANLCEQHHKPIDLVDMDDQCLVCGDCGLFGEHAGHEFLKIESALEQQKANADKIDQLLHKIENQDGERQSKTNEIIEEKKSSLERKLNEEFDKYIAKLQKKKQMLLEESNEYFNHLEKIAQSKHAQSNTSTAGNDSEQIKEWEQECQQRKDTWTQMGESTNSEICFEVLKYDIQKVEASFTKKMDEALKQSQAQLFEKLEKVDFVFDQNLYVYINNCAGFQTDQKSFEVIERVPKAKQSKESMEESKIQGAPATSTPSQMQKSVQVEKKTPSDKDMPKPMFTNETIKSLKKEGGLLIDHASDKKLVIKADRDHHDKITDWSLQRLNQAAQTVSEINHFGLNLDGCGYQITNRGMNSLANILESTKNLQTVDLSLRNFVLNDAGITALSIGLGKVLTLQKLKLSFSDCLKIENKGLPDLGACLLGTNLTDLDLNFSGCLKINDKGITALCAQLAKMSKVPGLKRFVLNMQGCTAITDAGLTKIAALFPELPWLETLDLNFTQCSKITNSALKEFSASIRKTKKLSTILNYFNLKSFNLSVGACDKIDDKGLMAICDEVSTFSELTNLGLDFHLCDSISNKGLISLSKSLNSVKAKLAVLKLNFQGCVKLAEGSILEFSLLLSKLTNLQILRLNFSDCKKLGDEDVSTLGTKISKLQMLKRLYLSFSRCPNIGDNSLDTLGHSLSIVPGLEELSLYFNGCNGIATTGIFTLSDSLAALSKTLHTLRLNLSKCERVNDTALTKISDDIGKIAGLKHLELYFVGCYTLSGGSLRDLSNSIDKLAHINTIQLFFEGCTGINKENKERITKSIEKIPYHYIVI